MSIQLGKLAPYSLLLLSAPLAAHPGHDHSLATSNIEHGFYYAGFALAAAAAALAIRSVLNRMQRNQQEDKQS